MRSLLPSRPETVTRQLVALQTELVDLACDLEHEGRADAADVAISAAARLREILADDTGAGNGVTHGEAPCASASHRCMR